MARRPIPMIELDELLYRWQQGHSISRLSRTLGQSRQTVRKYLLQAEALGLTRSGDEAERTRVLAAMRAGKTSQDQPSPSEQLLEPHREQLREWLAEPDMTVKQIWRLLRERGMKLSYPSVKRFVRNHLEAAASLRVAVRLETPPGQQAQVDFGKARVRIGEAVRSLWIFVMTLSFSRHRFVRFVERQDLATWLDCHVRAFEFFSGTPKTVLLDNLKAGVKLMQRGLPEKVA